ncbi:MAG TPA: hypothetical protein VHL60_07675 [Oxalicibacterium sp.]|jgi:ElaB/YqjD/DUF883 family membrane-anchored ribosome-binding protein|nr:hypothetical protein [Oxalicibacterium sp.]
MKTRHLFVTTLIAGFALVGLGACEKKNDSPGPAETAGKQIDQAAATANDKLQQAGEKLGESTSEMRKKLGEKMEQAGEKIQQAADRDKEPNAAHSDK